jgi:hypothetical protein
MLNVVVVVNDESISTDLLEHGDCSPAVVPDASCFPPGVVAYNPINKSLEALGCIYTVDGWSKNAHDSGVGCFALTGERDF